MTAQIVARFPLRRIISMAYDRGDDRLLACLECGHRMDFGPCTETCNQRLNRAIFEQRRMRCEGCYVKEKATK